MVHHPAEDAWRLSVDLPSERGASRKVTDEMLERLGAHGWSPSDIFAIHLAAEEAIVNAIVHGNRSDPLRKVEVKWIANGEGLRASVRDEGQGFDPGGTPDPRVGERLLNIVG